MECAGSLPRRSQVKWGVQRRRRFSKRWDAFEGLRCRRKAAPTYTTENVMDNFDGTETVTVTLNDPVSGFAARFVRIRITQP